MFRLRASVRVLVLSLGLLSLGAFSRADDGEKPTDKAKGTTAKDEKKEGKSDQRGGNCITRFWVHTVGGSIGSGLKTGAHKIAKAFD